MKHYSSEDLENMYNHIPQDDPSFRVIKEMFTLHFENAISQEQLITHKHFQDFVLYYKQYLQAVLDEKDPDEIARLHNEHHLDSAFKQLKDKALKKGTRQACAIRLAFSSGMIQYHSKLDLLGVHAFLDDMCAGTNVSVISLMEGIKNNLVAYEVYDKNDNYRLTFYIGSDEKLYVCVAHDTKTFIGDDGNARESFYVEVSSSYNDILTIIENNGYLNGSDTIEASFDTIIGMQSGSDDDDDSELSV